MRHPPDPPSWAEIHEAELNWKNLRPAIELLELRLAANPSELETIIHLGFTLWYELTEGEAQVPDPNYGGRWMELYRRYADAFSDNADFCHFFGIAMSCDWYFFPGASQVEAKHLLDRARSLDPMWSFGDADLSRLRGRGILAAYYHVA